MYILIEILKKLGFFLITTGGVGISIYLLDNQNPLGIIVFLATLGIGIIYLNLSERKKCPYCGTRSPTTGVSGSKFKQHYCKKCSKTFWTKLWSHKYEHEK